MDSRRQSQVLFIQRHFKDYESEPVILVVIENPLWHIRQAKHQSYEPKKTFFRNMGD